MSECVRCGADTRDHRCVTCPACRKAGFGFKTFQPGELCKGGCGTRVSLRNKSGYCITCRNRAQCIVCNKCGGEGAVNSFCKECQAALAFACPGGNPVPTKADSDALVAYYAARVAHDPPLPLFDGFAPLPDPKPKPVVYRERSARFLRGGGIKGSTGAMRRGVA